MNTITLNLIRDAIGQLAEFAEAADQSHFGSMAHRIYWERFATVKNNILEVLNNETTTPRLLLFAGIVNTNGGPNMSGGWLDFKGAFETRNQAMTRIIESGYDWWHIVDAETRQIVFNSETDEQPPTGI